MEKLTQITLAWDLFRQGVPKARIAQHLGRNRETIILWIQGIEQQGLPALLEHHQAAAKQPRPARQVRPTTKQLIWSIREREHHCCGQKIAYFLDKEYQITLSVPKIYEVLAEKYTLRSKWTKNQKRGQVPEADAARQVIQMDTVHFGQVFAFTAVDIFTREADVLLRPSVLAFCCVRAFWPPTAKRFCASPCHAGSAALPRPSRPTAARSLPLSLPGKPHTFAASTGSPVHTRRTNSRSSRVSTAPSGASAWAGLSTGLKSCRS